MKPLFALAVAFLPFLAAPSWADPPVADAISGAGQVAPQDNNTPKKTETTAPPQEDGNIISDFIESLSDKLARLKKLAEEQEAEAKKNAGGDGAGDPDILNKKLPTDGLFPPDGKIDPKLKRLLSDAEDEFDKEDRERLEAQQNGGQQKKPGLQPNGNKQTNPSRISKLTPQQRNLLRQSIRGTIPGYVGQSVPTRNSSGKIAAPTSITSQDTQRQNSAVTKALATGNQLKASLTTGGDDLAGPGNGPSTGGLSPKTGAGGNNAASPKTKSDLLLASVSGFSGSFAATGLMVRNNPGSQPDILRKDGTPATDKDLAALSAHIEGEPTALMRRPDYYDVLPRKEFEELKQDYEDKPATHDAQFKHIAMTGRDFQRSQSCEMLSGGCNGFAKKSYRKGEDVPPEDLGAIHDDLRPDPNDFQEEVAESASIPSKVTKPRGVGRAGIKSIYARLNVVIVGVQAFFGGNPGGSERAQNSATLASAVGFPNLAEGAPAAPLKLTEPRKLSLSAAPKALALPVASHTPPLTNSQRRAAPFLAGAMMLAGLALMRYWR